MVIFQNVKLPTSGMEIAAPTDVKVNKMQSEHPETKRRLSHGYKYGKHLRGQQTTNRSRVAGRAHPASDAHHAIALLRSRPGRRYGVRRGASPRRRRLAVGEMVTTLPPFSDRVMRFTVIAFSFSLQECDASGPAHFEIKS